MTRIEPKRPNPTIDSGGRSSDDPHFGEFVPRWVQVIIVILSVLAACFVAPYLGAPETHSATPRGEPDAQSLAGTGHNVQTLRGAPRPFLDSQGLSWRASLDSAGQRAEWSSKAGAPLAVRRISGTATWYCSATSACTKGYRPSDMVAAIDSDLGFRKGQRVRVTYFGRSVVVKIVDVCGCAGDRLIDLTSGAFRRLAPLDLGVIPVMLELAGPAPRAVPTAPNTSTEGEEDGR